MIWNNFLVDGVHEAAALLGYLASSLDLFPGDVCAIDSVEQIVEKKEKIVLLIEDSHEFQGMKMVTVYLEEDVVVENSIFAFMARNFKIDIYLLDEDSGYYRDLVLLDKTGGIKKVTFQGGDSMSTIIQDIAEQVLVKYGSLREPNYFELSVPSCDASALKESIEHIAEAQDYSDVNDDVCYRLDINGSIGCYEIFISWVGNYVAILENSDKSGRQVISGAGCDHLLNQIIEKIVSAGFVILEKSVLLMNMDFTLINSDDDFAPLYKVLFTDHDLRFS